MKRSIVHLTTAHPRFDSRIYYKQCKTLAIQGYDITLIVADGKGGGFYDGVTIIDLGTYPTRIKRILFSPWKAYFSTKKLAPAVVHIHDPELLLIGLCLKLGRIAVIYDAHEDLPSQIKRKFWIPHHLRPVLSLFSKQLLRFILFFFDAVVTATDGIAIKISHRKIVSIKNYPVLAEFALSGNAKKEDSQFCYAGLMT